MTHLAAWRALLDRLAEHDGLPASHAFHKAKDAVLARFEVDLPRYWNALEPSLAVGPQGTSHARFSYGFPRYRTDPARAAAELVELARSLGAGVERAAREVARAARHPAVDLPIFGLAVDPGGAVRAKLYLALRDDARDADKLVRALAPGVELGAEEALHLVGLDLSEAGGLVGAKLYVRGVKPSLAPLSQVGALADPLSVLRYAGPGAGEPTELDFAVGEGAWAHLVASAPALERVDPSRLAPHALVRRASLGVGGRAIAYYVLRGAP